MEMNIKTFVERFNRHEFDNPSRHIQIEAGWYDWFCKDTSLAKKTANLGSKVCKISDSRLFDMEKTYVFFKNNCPLVGALYDQFSICDIETGDVLFCIQHLEKGSHGCKNAHWEVYESAFGFEKPVINGKWNDVLKYFKQ